MPGTTAISIDPAPRIRYAVGSEARVFPLTSDEFFAHHGDRELGDQRLDMGFIDGLHLCDIPATSSRWRRSVTPGFVILMHDVYPIDLESAARGARPTCGRGTSGRPSSPSAFRPDLQVTSLKVTPTGLGIVTALDPASTVLADRHEEIVDWMGNLDYSSTLDNKDSALNAVDADPRTVRRLLPAPFPEPRC